MNSKRACGLCLQRYLLPKKNLETPEMAMAIADHIRVNLWVLDYRDMLKTLSDYREKISPLVAFKASPVCHVNVNVLFGYVAIVNS